MIFSKQLDFLAARMSEKQATWDVQPKQRQGSLSLFNSRTAQNEIGASSLPTFSFENLLDFLMIGFS